MEQLGVFIELAFLAESGVEPSFGSSVRNQWEAPSPLNFCCSAMSCSWRWSTMWTCLAICTAQTNQDSYLSKQTPFPNDASVEETHRLGKTLVLLHFNVENLVDVPATSAHIVMHILTPMQMQLAGLLWRVGWMLPDCASRDVIDPVDGLLRRHFNSPAEQLLDGGDVAHPPAHNHLHQLWHI